ncbi:MAG: hypothetical protein HYV34_04090 [Candidatus Kerfeldbacteria bacterium]|nr:hypothetical protein [Candidatus Kerfeldbacteria bacterium]
MHQVYYTRTKPFPGTRYADVYRPALAFYSQIKRKSKRRPYVRSAYFQKQKVFLELFWQHVRMKRNLRDKTRRVKYFSCAIELLEHSRFDPITKDNPNRSGELLHRFSGMAPNGNLYYVQVKENKRTGRKWLISVFPEEM